MSLVWIIYIIETILPMNLLIPTGMLVAFALIGYAVSFISFAAASDYLGSPEGTTARKFTELWNNTKKYSIGLIVAVFIMNTIGSFVPSTDTAYKMLAAYGVEYSYDALKESEDVQRIAGKSLQLVESTIDKYLEESEEVADKVKEETKE